MPDAYASADDLAAWLPSGTIVTDAARMLARASELVDETVRTPFDVDDDKMPTDADVAAALRDATCAVVEGWLEVGEANDIDGLAGTQISTGGYSGLRGPMLPPRAARILRNAGLLTVGVATTVAPFDPLASTS